MLEARDVENRPLKSRAFWRVSYAGHVPHQRSPAAFGGHHHHHHHHHHNTHQPQSHPPFVYQPPNSPPSRTTPPSVANDGDAAAAATRSLASSPPSLRTRPVVHLAPTDVGDSGASSFDVVESMPRSKLPSVRSMGSLVMVGSPDAGGPAHFASHRQGSAHHQHQHGGAASAIAGDVHTPSRHGGFMSTSQSMGSLTATPVGGRSSHFPDLGGMRRVRTPCSNGTCTSFPSVSPVTPLRTPLPPSVHGSPRRTPVNLPAAASAADDAINAKPKDVPVDESPARSMAHFRVVDTRGSAAGVGLRKHARWANSEPLTIGTATTDAIGAVFVEALLATLRGGSGGCGANSGSGRSFSSSGGASTPSSPAGALPPTPPNSEAASDDDDDTTDADDAAATSAAAPLERDERASFAGIAGNELALTEAFVRHVAAQEAASNPSTSNASRAIFSTQAWLRRSRRLQSIGFHSDDASAVDERTAALSAIFEQSFRASTGHGRVSTTSSHGTPTTASVYPLGGPAPHF